MRYFKLRQGCSPVYEIDKKVFEEKTKMQKPYYNKNASNENVQYAICPGCDNPIQIIGLYKHLENTNRPYGKHHMQSVPYLAGYNQQAYTYCAYASHRIKVSKTDRKPKVTGFERQIYNLMREQFDRIVYIWSSAIDIWITQKEATERLKTYVASQFWLYPWSTLNNLPWMFGYLHHAESLYNKLIRKDSELYRAILEKCPNAQYIEDPYMRSYVRLRNKEGKYLNLKYCVIHHEMNVVDHENVETLQMIVFEVQGQQEIEIFRKELRVDEEYFLNLIHLPKEREHRNQKLLEIAASQMPLLEDEAAGQPD